MLDTAAECEFGHRSLNSTHDREELKECDIYVLLVGYEYSWSILAMQRTEKLCTEVDHIKEI